MKDETLLNTVKNSLMIAGHEMGPVGDHWPAIRTIIKGVDKEFETMQRNEAVAGELEFHIADALRQVEEAAEQATGERKAQIEAFARDMWSRYYAIFEPVERKNRATPEELLGDDLSPIKNMRAASNIIGGMGGRS
jgi:hypothetical protein